MCLESRERDFLPSSFETHCYLRTFLQCLSICRQFFSELGLPKINCTLWCHGLAKWNHLYVVRAAQCSNVCRKGSEVLGTGSTGCLLPPSPAPHLSPQWGWWWKLLLLRTCGNDLDVQPLSPWASPPCSPPLFSILAGGRPSPTGNTLKQSSASDTSC